MIMILFRSPFLQFTFGACLTGVPSLLVLAGYYAREYCTLVDLLTILTAVMLVLTLVIG